MKNLFLNKIPDFFSVGSIENSQYKFSLPLANTNGIYFKNCENKNFILKHIQKLIMNLFFDIEKDLLEVYIIDIGLNIQFPYLRDLSQKYSNVTYITDKRKLNEYISQLINIAQDISLNYLSKNAPTIQDFNFKNDLKEKYRVIVFYENNALKQISNDYQYEFNNILQQSEKLGFHFIFSKWEELNDNHRNQDFFDKCYGLTINFNDNKFILDNDINRLNSIQNKFKITFDNISDEELREIFDNLCDKIKETESNYEDDVVVPLGKNGSRVINFSIGKKSSCYHTFISGQIGMGKSNILNTIILQIGEKYSPKEVELYLIDFKGSEFPLYKDHPNVKTLQADTNLSKTYYILSQIKQEGENRKTILSGIAKDIQEYNKKNPDNKLPIILIIIDEFQSIYDITERSTNKDLNAIFKEIARTYRFVGIYFILCTQKINDEKIDQDIISQTQIRIFTATTDFLGNRLLDSRNNFDLKKLKMGQALYNNKNGTKEGNHFVNINFAGNTEEITKKINNILAKNPRIFEFTDIDKLMKDE